MANENILELSKHLIPVFNEIKNAARMLSEATDNLSKTGLKQYTEHLKKTLKTSQLANDLDLEQIKTAEDLQKTLSKLEDQYDVLFKLEKESSKIAKLSLNGVKATAAQEKEALILARKTIESKYEEYDISLDMVDTLKIGIPLIRQEAEQRFKLIGSTDRLTKAHEGLVKQLATNVESFFTFSSALGYFKKSFITSYEQMNKLTSRGMLGAFATFNVLSLKLLLPIQELEEIINRNRDMVNIMGGGVEGIEAFGNEIGAVRQELLYLGKDASKAAARFVEMSKKSGLTPKDGAAYRKNLDDSMDQFKQFSGLFGDSYEDYANLMEQLQEEESVRKRLNFLSKDQLQLELEEIRKRTENLKLMGLSNTQIVEFNKQLQSIVNPRKNDFSERASQSLSFKQSANEMAKLLQKGGTPEDQAILSDLRDNQSAINKIADLNQQGRQKELADFLQSAEGAKAARAYSAASAKTDMSDQFDRGLRNNLMGRTGALGETVDKYGGALKTEKAQNKDITGLPKADQDKIIANAKDLVAVNSKTADALNALTIAIEGLKLFIENPFVDALKGVVAMFGALYLAGGIKGLLGTFNSLIKGGAAAEAAVAASAASGAGATGAATGAAAGAATFALGAAPVAVLGAATVAAQWAQDNPKEALKALHLDRKAESDMSGAERIKNQRGSDKDWVRKYKSQMEMGTRWSSSEAKAIKDKYGLEVPTETSTTQEKSNVATQTPSIATPSTLPQSSSDTTATGDNLISSVVSTGSGYLIVKRPNGTTEKITGSRSWRNNNPGNLEYNDFTKGLGAIGSDGRFAIFPTLEVGKKAKAKLLFEGKNYKNLSLSSAIARYAPPSENNTSSYQQNILASVGGQDKKMSDYSSQEQQSILAAMQKQEGFTPGLSSPYLTNNNESAKINPAPSTTTTTISTTPSKTTVAETELIKQTALLATLVKNTSGSKISARNDSYMQDPASVMGGIAG